MIKILVLFSDADISSSHCVAGHYRSKTGGDRMLSQSCPVFLAVHHLVPGQLTAGDFRPLDLRLLRKIII